MFTHTDMDYTIKANLKGSREMTITTSHLETIERYALFSDLLDSNGIVDEAVLDKLRLHVRQMLESRSDDKELLLLCKDVLFHNNMKAFTLHQLITLFLYWKQERTETPSEKE